MRLFMNDYLKAVNRIEEAGLACRQHIGWDQDDTVEIERRLDDRAADREQGAIR